MDFKLLDGESKDFGFLFTEMLKSNRAQLLNEIYVHERRAVLSKRFDDLIQELQRKQMPNLKTIKIAVSVRSLIDVQSIAKLAAKTENFTISVFYEGHTVETSDQEEIVTSVLNELHTNGNMKTKSLSIDSFVHRGGLSQLDPELLAKVVIKLSAFSMRNSGLTGTQVEKIIEKLTKAERCPLQTLILQGCPLTDVPPRLFMELPSRLRELQLLDVEFMDSNQQHMLFSGMIQEKSTLKRLALSDVEISPSIGHFLIVDGLTTLTELYLSYLSGETTKALLEHIANAPEVTLKKLTLRKSLDDFGLNMNNSRKNKPEKIDDNIFSRAIRKLKEVDLVGNKVDLSQTDKLFEDIVSFGSELHSLHLTFKPYWASLNDYNAVRPFRNYMYGDTEVICNALLTIEDVHFLDFHVQCFNEFIQIAKRSPRVKTRSITLTEKSLQHQRAFEDALRQNPHIQFLPHKMNSRMMKLMKDPVVRNARVFYDTINGANLEPGQFWTTDKERTHPHFC